MGAPVQPLHNLVQVPGVLVVEEQEGDVDAAPERAAGGQRGGEESGELEGAGGGLGLDGLLRNGPIIGGSLTDHSAEAGAVGAA